VKVITVVVINLSRSDMGTPALPTHFLNTYSDGRGGLLAVD